MHVHEPLCTICFSIVCAFTFAKNNQNSVDYDPNRITIRI